MGNCCSSLSSNPKKIDKSKDLGYPDDLLKFKVFITNVKMRNVPPDSSYVKIEFGEHKEMKTSEMLAYTTNYSFDFQEEFEYNTSRRDLYNHSLKMTLIDKSGKERAHLHVNLYEISNGPSHNDHTLRHRNSIMGRLTFDCRMSQIITVVIRPEVIACHLLENPKEKEYNFSLKLTGNHKEYFSEHSENFKNPLWGERLHLLGEPHTPKNSNSMQNLENIRRSTHSASDAKYHVLENRPDYGNNLKQITYNTTNVSGIDDELFNYNFKMDESRKAKKSQTIKNTSMKPNNLQAKVINNENIENVNIPPKAPQRNPGERITTNSLMKISQENANPNQTFMPSTDIKPMSMIESSSKNNNSILLEIESFNNSRKTNVQRPNIGYRKDRSSTYVQKPGLNELGSFRKQTGGLHASFINQQAKKEIRWDYRNRLEEPPILKMELNVHDIASNSFQFFLWAIKEKEATSPLHVVNHHVDDDDNDSEHSDIYIDHKLIGECYISLYKIYSEDNWGADENINHFSSRKNMLIDPLRSNTNYSIKTRQLQINRISDFNEKLWYHGVCVGTFAGEFCVSNDYFYRQMLCGVLSDNGPLKSTQLILKKPHNLFSVFTNTIPKEVKTLSSIKENLSDCVFKLSKEKDSRTQKRIIDDLAKNLIQLPDLLKTSHKQSMVSFVYHSEEDLLASQTTFVDIALHLLEYCDEAPITQKPTYYECLTLIVNRGEFELSFMGFNQDYAEVFLQNAGKANFKNENPKLLALRNIKQKLKVCLNYQSMLYHILEKVLNKLTQKKLDDKEREFVEHFCAIAYFRIPEFRDKLLECLIQSSNEQNIAIEEWRGTEWNLDAEIKYSTKNQDFISLFDWEKDFYRFLKDSPKGQNNFKFLRKILSDEGWYRRMAKRGIAFYFFLSEWAKHVSKTVVIKDQVPWQDLPGYNVLVKSFLIELKKRDVKHYPEALITSSVSLLKNEKLLSVFVTILYKKTSIYDSMAIFSIFDIINEWFQTLIKNNKKIPLTFDNLLFVKGIILIIDGEHALNIAKVLWMIYNNFNIFHLEVRRHLCEYLLNDVFFKLFLHWSWTVRQVFHHLLLYRIYHQHRTIMTGVTSLAEARRALFLAYEKGQTLNRSEKEGIINDLINFKFQRNMNIIEKARAKMIKEKDLIEYNKRFEKRFDNQSSNHSKDRIERLTSQNRIKLIRRESGLLNTINATPVLYHSISVDQGLLSSARERLSPKNSFTLNDSKLNLSMNELGIIGERTDSKPGQNVSDYDIGISKDGQPSAQSLLDIDTQKEDLENVNAIRKSSLEMVENSDGKRLLSPDKLMSKRKLVINRRFYLAKELNSQNLLQRDEIPSEFQVYLLQSCGEYDKIKQGYKEWLLYTNEKFNFMSDTEKREWLFNPKVPELNVKIPLDDSESNAIELDDEW